LIVRLTELLASDPEQMREILTELFGEVPTGAAFESYYQELALTRI